MVLLSAPLVSKGTKQAIAKGFGLINWLVGLFDFDDKICKSAHLCAANCSVLGVLLLFLSIVLSWFNITKIALFLVITGGVLSSSLFLLFGFWAISLVARIFLTHFIDLNSIRCKAFAAIVVAISELLFIGFSLEGWARG